jgi:hypothetical protein
MTSGCRAMVAVLLLVCLLLLLPVSRAASTVSTDQFLDNLEKAHFRYFIEYSDSNTGLTADSSRETACSIAAVGFSLSSYIIAAERSYISTRDARNYVLKTLRFLWSLPQGEGATGVSGYHGFFYHFLDAKTGLRTWNCELSTIDTAILMAGVLSCYTYFDGTCAEEEEIRDLAKKLFDRVDWKWMYRPNGYICMGWDPSPGKGYLDSCWNMFCEGPLLILIAAGSPTHPVPAEAWSNYCHNFKMSSSFGKERLNFAPTYGYQYPQCWIDFRGLKDAKVKELHFDYFENARRILLAQYAYAEANPKGWRDYGKDCWGLTACDGPGNVTKEYKGKKVEFRAYSARGCPDDFDDGTIAPTAIAASLPYTPDLIIPTLKTWREKRPELWSECGFHDAFNPSFDESKPSGWVDPSFLGIDQGPIVIMIENHRTGFLWDLMKRNEVFVRGLKRSGFSGGWLSEDK